MEPEARRKPDSRARYAWHSRVMPPVGSPSPFGFPSQRPRSAAARSTAARGADVASRSPAPSSSGPQFASTPRFLLPGNTPSRFNRDDIDSSDHDEPSSPVATATAARGKRDVIEDSEEEHDLSDPSQKDQSLTTGPGYLRVGERDIVAEFDELFPPTPDRTKRRRISVDPEMFSQYHTRPHADPIISSPSDPPSPSEVRHGSPLLSTSLNRAAAATPAPRRNVSATTETPRPSTSMGTKTPFRIQAHSVFSASQTVSRPSSHLRFGSSTPAPPSPPQRKKPAFVLPRSPSPSSQVDDASIPTPFSPSSHSLRRGRPRSNTPSYLPGGMAAEVRSWILETAAQREHHQRTQQSRPSSVQGDVSHDPEKYFLTAEVASSSHGILNSGSLTFVNARSVSTQLREVSLADSSREKNLLLLGPPRLTAGESGTSSKSGPYAPSLDESNLIGIHPGLAWEIELDSEDIGEERYGSVGHSDDEEVSTASRSRRQAVERGTEKWVVGMEWDLLR